MDALTPQPILSLERWRTFFQLSPWHFWGLSNRSAPTIAGCGDVVREYAWQAGDSASRSEIRQAIADAEARLTEYLGHSPAPRYTEFALRWPRFSDARYQRSVPADHTGRRLSVQLPEGEIRAVGVLSRTLLDTVAPAYTDEDGDGLEESFTLTCTVPSGTTASSLAAYVASTDRWDGSAVSERWRIAPVQASVSGTTATIRGASWICVRPVRYQGVPTSTSGGGGPSGLDPDTTTNFLPLLEVYALATDPNGETLDTAQAVIEWDSHPALYGYCCCNLCAPSFPAGTNQCDPAAMARVVARCGVRDGRQGLVLPATAVRSATAGEWSETLPTAWEPDRVVVRVLAGKALTTSGDYDPLMLQAVCYLSAALLARPICACADTNRAIYNLQFDLTLSARQDELYSTSDPDIGNPFGTRRGAVLAWKIVKRLARARAFTF